MLICEHDDVIKWKHFPRNWPFVRGIHRSPVNSPHKGQWCGALMFPLICVGINDWVNNGEAGDLRRYRVHYDVIVMKIVCISRRRVHRRHLESRWRISVTSWKGDELCAVDNPCHYTWDILDMARWDNILPFRVLYWLGDKNMHWYLSCIWFLSWDSAMYINMKRK